MLEGAVEVMVGRVTTTLLPDQEAVARRNSLHSFRYPTDEPTTYLAMLRPGHGGFEKALKVAYGLASEGRTFADGTPKNPYHLGVLIEWSEVRVPGVFTVAEPLFRLLAKRDRSKGIDKELEARYCR